MSESRTGTQSIERAVQVLRVLSERDRFGWRLVDLAERCGLSRGTTHRILASLLRQRLVRQRPEDRRYVLGPQVFELGLGMATYADFREAGHQTVQRLAERFRTLSIFYLRSGDDTVCAACEGPSPYASGFEVGTRLPLAGTVGGMAILGALPASERAALLPHCQPSSGRRGLADAGRLERMLELAERNGYAVNAGEVTNGIHSFGVPLRDADGQAFAALAIAGTAEAFPVERTGEVVAALGPAADALEQAARDGGVRSG